MFLFDFIKSPFGVILRNLFIDEKKFTNKIIMKNTVTNLTLLRL